MNTYKTTSTGEALALLICGIPEVERPYEAIPQWKLNMGQPKGFITWTFEASEKQAAITEAFIAQQDVDGIGRLASTDEEVAAITAEVLKRRKEVFEGRVNMERRIEG